MLKLYKTLNDHNRVCQNRVGDLFVITSVDPDAEHPITAVTIVCPPGRRPLAVTQHFSITGAAFSDGMDDDEDLLTLNTGAIN